MLLVYCNEVSLLINTIPQHIHALVHTGTSLKQSFAVDIRLAFPTNHKQPFPLLHYCATSKFLSPFQVTQTNYLSQKYRPSTQNSNPTRDTRTVAVVALETAGPPSLPFGLLELHLGVMTKRKRLFVKVYEYTSLTSTATEILNSQDLTNYQCRTVTTILRNK
jgi:hypothetical protein